jgi:tetratricopeptide (TPR) repeat protein
MIFWKGQSRLGLILAFAAISASAAFAASVGDSPATIHCLETVTDNPTAAMAEAEALYQGANTIGSRHCLGDALVAQGEAARGARILDSLAQEVSSSRDLTPEVQGAIWGDAGRAWLEADEIDKALAAFDAAVGKTPKDMGLRVDRAVALGNARRYWEAIDDLNLALSNGIDTAEAYLLRASAYREVGTAELAMDDINRAAAKAPDDPNIILERGRIRKLAKDIPGAQRDFLNVMKIAPGSDAGNAAHHEMESLSGRQPR